MQRSLLADPLAHHVWATVRLIEACERLTPAQLGTTEPGTFGSILETLRHTVGADSWYLFRLSGGRHEPIDDETEATLDLARMRELMESHADRWEEVVAANPDPDEMIEVPQEDGSVIAAPKGLRFAQVVHHGTDHRSQVCTALTAIGIEPPEIDLWAYGDATGLIRSTPAKS